MSLNVSKITALILAGGFATRLWPLTEFRAKPLVLLAGKPILSHIVEQIPQGIPIVISTNRVFEEEFYRWRNAFPHRDIEIFIEDSKGEESKKGALAAVALVLEEKKIFGDLLLIAGDNYFGFQLSDFLAAGKGNPLLAAYDVGDLSEAKQFGVVVTDPSGRVTEFQEKPLEPKSTLVSTGCYLFPQAHLSEIISYAAEHKDDLGGVFESYLKKGIPVDSFAFSEKWFDIGSFSALIEANRELQGDQIIKKEGVQIEGVTELLGAVYLGNRVQVTNSTLENCVILDRCELSDVVLRDCILDEGVVLSGLDLNRKVIRAGSTILL